MNKQKIESFKKLKKKDKGLYVFCLVWEKLKLHQDSKEYNGYKEHHTIQTEIGEIEAFVNKSEIYIFPPFLGDMNDCGLYRYKLKPQGAGMVWKCL